jgi:hypothetical protein
VSLTVLLTTKFTSQLNLLSVRFFISFDYNSLCWFCCWIFETLSFCFCFCLLIVDIEFGDY